VYIVDESNDEWATTPKEPTNMFRQLDEGIDVFVLVNDGLPLVEPLIGLEDYPCMLDVIGISTSTTRVAIKGIPLNTNKTIVEEVQQTCEMLKEVKGQVKASTFGRPMKPKQPNVESDLEHPNMKLDHVDNVAALQGTCKPLYKGVRCSKLVTTMTIVNMCTIHGCSNKFVDELFSLLHKFI
jgi:hypothetical protein